VPVLNEVGSGIAQVMPIVMAASLPTPLLHHAAAICAAAAAERCVSTDSRGMVRMIAAWSGQSEAIEKLGRGGKA